MKSKIELSGAIISLLLVMMAISCKKDDNKKNDTNCFLITTKNSGDTIIQTNTYDAENRPINIQYYTNATPAEYVMYTYTSQSYNYDYFTKDGTKKTSYENLLPFNSQGLSAFAYYVSYNESSTRYDSIFYEYNASSYKSKETRWIKMVSLATGDITLGLYLLTYTYDGDNCTKIEGNWDVGNNHSTNTFEYEFYLNEPNTFYNHTPWLGQRNANNIRKSIFTNLNRNTNIITRITTTDFINIYDSDGKMTTSTQSSSTIQDGQTSNSTLVYKYTYECK